MKKAVFILFFLSCVPIFPTYSQVFFHISSKKGKFGLELDGKWKIKPVNDSIIRISAECYVIKKKGQYRLYTLQYGDKKNYRLEPGNYTNFEYTGGSTFSIKDKKGKLALFDRKGHQQTKFIFSRIVLKPGYALCKIDASTPWWMYDASSYYSKFNSFSADSVAFLTNAVIGISNYDPWKVTLIHDNGKMDEGVTYQPAMGKQTVLMEKSTGEKAFMDKDGNMITNWYTKIEPLKNGAYTFTENYYSGIMNAEGQIIIPASSAYIQPEGNFFWVRHGKNNYELYDMKGNSILSCYNWEKICTDLFICYKSGNQRLIYNTRTRSSEWDVEKFTGPKEGMIKVEKKNVYFYMDTLGTKRSQDFAYGYVQRYRTSLGDALLGLFKVVTVFPAVVDIMSGENPFGDSELYTERVSGEDFKNGMAKVIYIDSAKQVRYGFIDTSLQLRIRPVYENVLGFYGDIGFVSKKGRWAMINKKEEMLTGYIFTEVEYFSKDMIVVKKTGDYYIINGKGEKAPYPAFSFYMHGTGNTLRIYPGHKHYILKENGEMVPG